MMAERRPRTGPCDDGDVVLVLHVPSGSRAAENTDRIGLEMRLVNARRWAARGVWSAPGNQLPHAVAPTSSAITAMHTGLLEAEEPPRRTVPTEDLRVLADQVACAAP
jgi:hypothetical protein